MHNKVVYHAMKAFSSFGLPVLRFNFRSVGLSEGEHDEGVGEQEDVKSALDWLENNFHQPILFAGFSFGSNVGMRACCGDARVKGLVGLGLPMHAEGRDYKYGFLPKCTVPKLFVSGDHDPYGPRKAVEAVYARARRAEAAGVDSGCGSFLPGDNRLARRKAGTDAGRDSFVAAE